LIYYFGGNIFWADGGEIKVIQKKMKEVNSAFNYL